MKRKIFYGALISLCSAHAALTASSSFWVKMMRNQRRINAHTQKSAVANFDEHTRVATQTTNGDEQRYADKRGNFNKALAHLSTGFPSTTAYASLIHAVERGNSAAFDQIILGGDRHLVNPQAFFAFDLTANDGWIHTMPAAPSFDSGQTAAEMVEDYWAALLRDVPFNEFGTNALAIAAATELSGLSNFEGPKINGAVTATTLLRGNGPGELVGPYISQLLYLPVPLGSMTVSQTLLPPKAVDFITSVADYLTVINGGSTGATIMYGSPTFIRTPRDMTEYVHKDFPCLAGTNAALILNSFGSDALDRANPYLNNPTQDGFVTFGISQLLELIQDAAHAALKAAWYQKWFIHRRLRPEEFGFYVQQQMTTGTNLGISLNLTGSDALARTFMNNGTYLLPQAYPEGSPAHPSYPAGHALFIGAGVTILKAWFNEDFVIPSPLQPNAANDTLVAYAGTLTIGGELNKLASNIALGRDHAGVHYRSDGWQGMLLGEKIAIDVLNNAGFLFNEAFDGFSLTTFEGETITVGQKRIP